MKNGNWVPICKAAIKTLPINRAFSEVEALFSLSCDYDNDKPVSESGLAKRWIWSRKKVRLFLERIGVNILYQIDKKRSPLGGQVGVQARDKLGTSLEQVRFIDFNNLGQQRDKLGTSEGQARDKLGDTTIDPDPKSDPKPKEKNSKLSVETSDEVRLPDIFYGFAVGLKNWVMTHKKIKISEKQLKAWKNSFRLLAKMDLPGTQEEKEERISIALKWYVDNAPSEFIPVIESGSSFKEKFTKLENAMNKENKKDWAQELREKHGIE